MGSRRAVAIIGSGALVVAGCGSSGTTSSLQAHAKQTAGNSRIRAALISGTGGFHDRSFNESQLQGLNRARAYLGVKAMPLQSSSSSDYVPNLSKAARSGSNLIVSAGSPLAKATNAVATRYPSRHFAITDFSAKDPPVSGRDNVEGLTFAANESGCLVGNLAAAMVKRQGGKQVIGAVGGENIQPVNVYIAGYRYCAEKADPNIRVLVQYSHNFAKPDLCSTVAEREIAQGAQALFQVAGGCGLGTLKTAAAHNVWGIGVDKDQYHDAGHVLTSAVKRVDNGVFAAIQQVIGGRFQGGGDLVFNLANHGVDVGEINPSVPLALIDDMHVLRDQIVAGQVKVPSA